MNVIDTLADTDKRGRILENALAVFLAYGFSRTTMDDIARAAGVSRPALYVHFRNKTDIYRALADKMLRGSVESAAAQLDDEAPFEDRLFNAIDASLLQLLAKITNSPHGAELVDVNNSLASDMLAEWQGSMGRLFASAIGKEAHGNAIDLERHGLDAGGLAETLLDGLEGMKARVRNPAGQADATRRLVRLVALAVQP